MNAFIKVIAAQLIANHGKAQAIEVVKYNLRKRIADNFASIGGVHSLAWFNARATTNATDKQIIADIFAQVQAL